MRIAVFGDLHGHWVAFREAILGLLAEGPLDLVLQVGDAQPIRTEEDLAFMPVPEHHRTLGDYALVGTPGLFQPSSSEATMSLSMSWLQCLTADSYIPTLSTWDGPECGPLVHSESPG